MKKISIKRRKAQQESPARITNETVAEHREKIIAGGRKFKYPMQYARHKLVINALFITLVSIILLLVLGWYLLYVMQSSSGVLYRLTKVIPVPVASVNGEMVRFSDYLLQYRGSEYYLDKYDEIKLDSVDGKRQLDHIKRQSMDKAIANAYARQKARDLHIKVTSKDVDDVINQQRNTANGRISQEAYDASSMMMYGWTPADYRSAVKQSILGTKVAFAVDKTAEETQNKAIALLKSNGEDFNKTAEELNKASIAKVTVGQSGLVSTSGTLGGLRLSEVAKGERGKLSDVLRSATTDGYYIVKITDKTDTQVNFVYLHIPLTTFINDLESIKKSGKVDEYIHIPEEKKE